MEPFLIPVPVETGSHILSSWVDPVHTVCSRVQTMVWLCQWFGFLNAHKCQCMQLLLDLCPESGRNDYIFPEITNFLFCFCFVFVSSGSFISFIFIFLMNTC